MRNCADFDTNATSAYCQTHKSRRVGPGIIWGLGVAVHNRTTSAGPALADQIWPESFNPWNPSTWGQLSFGLLPAYQAPSASNQKTVTIKQGVNNQTVADVNVGGYTQCGTNLDMTGSTFCEFPQICRSFIRLLYG